MMNAPSNDFDAQHELATDAAEPAAAEGALAPARRLEALLDPFLDSLGYELVHVEWTASGRHRKLIVYADRSGGLTLDDCARLSPLLSAALDAAEADPATPEFASLLGPPYVLEVSSPGLDRPLSRRSQFARFIGHKATIRTSAPLHAESNQRTFHGRITAVEPDAHAPTDEHRGSVTLTAEDGPVHCISLALVRRANLVYED